MSCLEGREVEKVPQKKKVGHVNVFETWMCTWITSIYTQTLNRLIPRALVWGSVISILV